MQTFPGFEDQDKTQQWVVDFKKAWAGNPNLGESANQFAETLSDLKDKPGIETLVKDLVQAYKCRFLKKCDETSRCGKLMPQRRAQGFPVGPQHLEQTRREHNVAILAPFTLIDVQRHALVIDVGYFEVDRFGDPQTGCINGHKNRSMLEAVD
jgi:hypothetical protein